MSSSGLNKILFSHDTNRLCFNKCPGKIITNKADNDGHWVACVLEVDGIIFILINVYGYNNKHKNKQLLHQVTTFIKELNTIFPTDHILVGGDFNLTQVEWMDR